MQKKNLTNYSCENHEKIIMKKKFTNYSCEKKNTEKKIKNY